MGKFGIIDDDDVCHERCGLIPSTKTKWRKFSSSEGDPLDLTSISVFAGIWGVTGSYGSL